MSQVIGTAGTLLSNIEHFRGGMGVLIHADNYTEIDLTELIIAHSNKPWKHFNNADIQYRYTPILRNCKDEKRVVNHSMKKLVTARQYGKWGSICIR